MKDHFLIVMLLAGLLFLPASATVNKKTITIRAVRGRHVVYVKKHEQQRVFSFLDTPQAAKPVEPVKKPLTGIVVKQELAPEVSPPIQAAPPISVTTLKTEPVQPNDGSNFLSSFFREFFKPSSPKKIVSIRQSWVMPLRQSEDQLLAKSFAEFVAWKLPARTSTLLLAAPANGPDDNTLTQAFTLQLRKTGFAIAGYPNQVPGVHTVQYLVTPLDFSDCKGILVRIRVDGTEASRWFQYDLSGALIAASPFTIRENEPFSENIP